MSAPAHKNQIEYWNFEKHANESSGVSLKKKHTESYSRSSKRGLTMVKSPGSDHGHILDVDMLHIYEDFSSSHEFMQKMETNRD